MIAPVEPRQPRLWYAAFQLNAPMYVYLAEFGAPISYGYLRRSFPLRDYQTLFAREMGSSEMPSAARPFTKPSWLSYAIAAWKSRRSRCIAEWLASRLPNARQPNALRFARDGGSGQ